MNVPALLLVFLGGGLGSVCRYALSLLMARGGSPLPWATLGVNVLGCLLIGVFAQTLARDSALRALFITGFCGGFTTFSTLSLECLALWQAQQFGWLALYVGASLVLGLAAVAGGFALARAVLV